MSDPASGDLCVANMDISQWVTPPGSTIGSPSPVIVKLQATSAVNFCSPFVAADVSLTVQYLGSSSPTTGPTIDHPSPTLLPSAGPAPIPAPTLQPSSSTAPSSLPSVPFPSASPSLGPSLVPLASPVAPSAGPSSLPSAPCSQGSGCTGELISDEVDGSSGDASGPSAATLLSFLLVGICLLVSYLCP